MTLSPDNGQPNGWPPTPAQTRLLRFLLANADVARAAWREWIVSVDLERLDAPSMAVLPSLPARLKELGIAYPEIEKLRGVHRHHWYRNHLLFEAGWRAIETLDAAGVNPVISGGAAVLPIHHRDWGARPLPTIEIVVAPHRARDAAAELARSGWQAQGRAAARLPDAVLCSSARLVFRDSRGFDIALRWRMFDWRIAPGPDISAMHPVPVSIDERPATALDATDLLLLTCADDIGAGDPVTVGLLDAAALVRGGGVDWNRFAEQTTCHALGWIVARRLAWLALECGTAVPAGLTARLSEASAGAVDRVAGSDAAAPAAYRFARHLVRCVRHHRPWWDVLGYVKDVRDLPHRSDALRRDARRRN